MADSAQKKIFQVPIPTGDSTGSTVNTGLGGDAAADQGVRALPISDLEYPVAVTYDPVSKHVYWTDLTYGSITKAALDGSFKQTIVFDNNGMIITEYVFCLFVCYFFTSNFVLFNSETILKKQEISLNVITPYRFVGYHGYRKKKSLDQLTAFTHTCTPQGHHLSLVSLTLLENGKSSSLHKDLTMRCGYHDNALYDKLENMSCKGAPYIGSSCVPIFI